MTCTEETARRRTGQQLMAFVGAAAFFASAPGQSFLIAVFVDEMLRATGLDRTTFSGLYAAGTVVSAAVMLVLGKVIDRRGVRVAWAAVTAGLALSCGLASVATGAVVVFGALAMLRTFGQGSFPLLGTLLVAHSFARRRGQAMAVANLGLTSASVLLPPVVAAAIVAVGWRHAFQILAVALLVVVLPLALLVRDRHARPRPARGTDTTGGTAGLGAIQGTAQSSMITAAAVAPLIPAVSHGATGSY